MTKEEIQALVDQMACASCFDDRQIFYAILERLHSGVPVTVQLDVGDAVVGGTEGSVLFVGPGGTLAQDNTNFFYNDSTDQLKVGGSTITPLVIGGAGVTDALALKGTTGNGTSGSSALRFLVGNNGNLEAITVLNNGNVGVNLAAPTRHLDIGPNPSGGANAINVRSQDTTFDTTADQALFRCSDSNAAFKAAFGYVYRASLSAAGLVLTSVDSIYFEVNGSPTPSHAMLTNGKVGFGTLAPDKACEINLGTADALRLTYNDSNGGATTYMDTTLSSVGLCTFTAAGSAPGFAFSAPVRLKGYTVGTLPTGAQGDRAFVTDATTPTYNGALTGGGAVVVPVFHNGSAWVSA